MKKIDYKGKNQTELMKTLKEKHEALKNFRFNISGSKVRNVKEGRMLRREVARILTEMNVSKSKVTSLQKS